MDKLISKGLNSPTTAISYETGKQISELFPDRYVLETASESFDIEEFCRDGHCTLLTKDSIHSEVRADWSTHYRTMTCSPVQSWHAVTFNGSDIDLVRLSWQDFFCRNNVFWIIAKSQEVAETFFTAVCNWSTRVTPGVYVFDQGYWHKNNALHEAIQNSNFDGIILAGELKSRIDEDFKRFFASKETYHSYGIPWKRGALFIGPPGNGKTQTIKAIINSLGIPCLYAKSLASDRGTEHANVHSIFKKAREMSPCVLVMEDLDSMVNALNRSYFLNELDGFAANEGVMVLATTNHPERLDPAILERPSRFDRKYYFTLPATAERTAYLQLWNRLVQPQLRISEDGLSAVVEQTDGFSFAYLKEMMLSAVMAWMETSVPLGTLEMQPGIEPKLGAMDSVALQQVANLRNQMAFMNDTIPEPAIGAENSVFEGEEGYEEEAFVE